MPATTSWSICGGQPRPVSGKCLRPAQKVTLAWDLQGQQLSLRPTQRRLGPDRLMGISRRRWAQGPRAAGSLGGHPVLRRSAGSERRCQLPAAHAAGGCRHGGHHGPSRFPKENPDLVAPVGANTSRPQGRDAGDSLVSRPELGEHPCHVSATTQDSVEQSGVSEPWSPG